jgi:ribosomal protein S18 acetylase RimI-like enzyme
VNPDPTDANRESNHTVADCAVVRRLEELTLNAWPGLKQAVLDGWVARLARGFTGRANSVVPLESGTWDPLQKIEFFESLYAAHGLPCTFKLTDVSRPAELGTLLKARGYRESRRASVQVCDGLLRSGDDGRVEAQPAPWPQWTDSVVGFRSFSVADATTLSEILAAIALPCRFAVALDEHGTVAACGLGVLEGEWVGLYDIVTRPDARRRGHAARVVRSLLGWAGDNGASRAYLQVMIDNGPALALYAGLGFRQTYQYAYRTKDTRPRPDR